MLVMLIVLWRLASSRPYRREVLKVRRSGGLCAVLFASTYGDLESVFAAVVIRHVARHGQWIGVVQRW
jgi:hypothetical protein